MDILWWIALPILAVVVIHYYKKRGDLDKAALSAGLESVRTVSVLNGLDSEVQELKARLVDLEKQLSMEGFTYVGASGKDDRFSLHYLDHGASTVVTLTEDSADMNIGCVIDIGSETKDGHFYLTSEEVENSEASLPAIVNVLFVEPGTSFSRKAELHRDMVSNYELKEIEGIDGVVQGANRMFAILHAHAISTMY